MISAETVLKELETLAYNSVLSTHGENTALAAANAIFDCLWINFKEMHLYIPVSDWEAKKTRNEAIFKEFNGSNHRELAVKFRLSCQSIYNITNKMRAARSIKRSPNGEKPLDNLPITIFVITEYLPPELVAIGLSKNDAALLSKNITAYLCEQFTGVTIIMSHALKRERQVKGNLICF